MTKSRVRRWLKQWYSRWLRPNPVESRHTFVNDTTKPNQNQSIAIDGIRGRV
ncbi:hypothetical protein [Saccharibacillus sp. JS10]|uniref:hypothetical protein n=1 Tax=Saccharibacillus sp. JS10 TaxID=2950552 RepID=UPI00210F1804|nr:hypothetical protein [Saccharibacillus sp. JS10]MCQ4086883.1 hypothetical protein [Saccharibacillus sp. JS10]